jgi:hypothetical protein
MILECRHGRRSSAEVLAVFKVDIDALSDRIGAGPIFHRRRDPLGRRHRICTLIHIIGVPFKGSGKGYALSKQNRVSCCNRVKERLAAAT